MDVNDITKPLWRDGYHNAAKYIEQIAKDYREICCEECIGDKDVGVPCCPYYEFPDVGIKGGCQLIVHSKGNTSNG